MEPLYTSTSLGDFQFVISDANPEDKQSDESTQKLVDLSKQTLKESSESTTDEENPKIAGRLSQDIKDLKSVLATANVSLEALLALHGSNEVADQKYWHSIIETLDTSLSCFRHQKKVDEVPEKVDEESEAKPVEEIQAAQNEKEELKDKPKEKRGRFHKCACTIM